MGSPLEQAPYAAMMARELGAVVISVSYRIGPFHQFPAAIHDAEDVLSAILDTAEVSEASKVLRTEINRYNSITEENRKMLRRKKGSHSPSGNDKDRPKIVLDPTRLCISGFSAGGNIALNMGISVPPCSHIFEEPPSGTVDRRKSTADRRKSTADKQKSSSDRRRSTAAAIFSPVLLPPTRNATILDDPDEAWPTVLPSPEVQSKMIPFLLFYPSLDARLLPHERPKKPMPKALKGDDKRKQKPKQPGLFSIMGPTYLPKKLRPHPRASPGLVDTDNVQRNAALFLVLPEKDTLAVQSDVWVDKMNSGGWTGPVRFGDGRADDWDGDNGARPTPPTGGKPRNGGLEVWHAPECRHGWTQFPTPALGAHERKERDLVFARALDFVRDAWNKELPVERLAAIQEPEPLRLPGSEASGLLPS